MDVNFVLEMWFKATPWAYLSLYRHHISYSFPPIRSRPSPTPAPSTPHTPQNVACSTQILRKAAKQAEEAKRAAPSSGAGSAAAAAAAKAKAAAAAAAAATTPKVGGGAGSVRKKRRWDDGGVTPGGGGDETPAAGSSGHAVSDWDADVATPVRSFGGGETPGRTPGRGGETPGRSRWDQTPSRDAQVCLYLMSVCVCICRLQGIWDVLPQHGVSDNRGTVVLGGVA